jgi:integrase
VKHRAALDSPATIYRRNSIVNAIRTGLGRVSLAKLTAHDIDSWYDTLRGENIGTDTRPRYRTESTIHHYHRVLHAILHQAYLWDMTDRTPAAKATTPKKRRHARINAPTPAAVMVILADAGPDLAIAVRLLISCGMRRGELAALRWTDVDLDRGTVTITKSLVDLPRTAIVVKAPKTDESVRVVELDNLTVELLEGHQRRQRSVMTEIGDDAYLLADPLSSDRTGRTPRSPDWISRAWRAQCRKHGVKIRLHDLRHAHVTSLLMSGVPVPIVSRRVGHSKPSTTTDIYTHVTLADDHTAALAIGRALEKGTT